MANATNITLGGGIFGAMNYAFFLPRERFMAAMDWWRQHHGVLHYMLHANTGCEYEDHSTWSIKSNNSPPLTKSIGSVCSRRRSTNSPNTSSTMKVIFAALVALFSVASAVELTPANFEAEVKGEKNAFVKFQAPWCDPHAQSPQNRQPIAAAEG